MFLALQETPKWNCSISNALGLWAFSPDSATTSSTQTGMAEHSGMGLPIVFVQEKAPLVSPTNTRVQSPQDLLATLSTHTQTRHASYHKRCTTLPFKVRVVSSTKYSNTSNSCLNTLTNGCTHRLPRNPVKSLHICYILISGVHSWQTALPWAMK